MAKQATLIGSTWTDEKGRDWKVTRMVSVGRYEVFTSNKGHRVGEMDAASLRATIAKATSK